MAKLYFRYGVMGSSKTANALMVRYNYEERGQEALLVKPEIDQRDGAKFVASRMGLTHPCIYFSEMRAMPEEELLAQANQWEMAHGGLSGRTAQQFIDYLLGKEPEKE